VDDGDGTHPLADLVITCTRRDGSTYIRRIPRPRWYAEVYRLWRLGLNDGEIARSLERPVDTIYTARARQMKLPRNTYPGGQDR